MVRSRGSGALSAATAAARTRETATGYRTDPQRRGNWPTESASRRLGVSRPDWECRAPTNDRDDHQCSANKSTFVDAPVRHRHLRRQRSAHHFIMSCARHTPRCLRSARVRRIFYYRPFHALRRYFLISYRRRMSLFRKFKHYALTIHVTPSIRE